MTCRSIAVVASVSTTQCELVLVSGRHSGDLLDLYDVQTFPK